MLFNVSFNPILVSLVLGLLGVITFVITFIRTGNIKKALKDFSEVFDLKFKTVSSDRSIYSQSFSPEVKNYVLDSSTNELEELPIPKNIQDYIQSHIETCLERALDKLLPSQNIKEDDLIADYTHKRDDLAVLGEAIELAESYRSSMHLPDNMSIAQIFSEVDKSAQSIKGELAKLSVSKSEEVIKDEKNS